MINFDFDSIKARIIASLSAKSEWADFLSYSTNVSLIEPIAQELAYQAQYKEYLTYENWWSLARNKSSLLVESPVHGYVVPRKYGSVGTLRVSASATFNAPHTSNISIPKYFEFSNGDFSVVSKQDYTLSNVNNYIDIQAVQGKPHTVEFLAQGLIYETKEILDDGVEQTLFDLYVNNVLWTRVDSLFEYNSNDLVYEIKTMPSLKGITLRFGNNVCGKKLNLNDVVLFKYISTKGLTGNIYTTGNVTTVESQAYDATNLALDIYVTNTTAFSGGVDYPSLDEIRTLSPKVFQSGDRASTKSDYETIIGQYNYISKVSVWGAYETLKDDGLDPWTFIPSEENVVHVAALNALYSNLSTAEKNSIIEDIHSKADPTDILQFETVEIIKLLFYVNAVVSNSSYVLVEEADLIRQTLINNYGIENISFNQNIYNSDFISLIDSVAGIRNHTSYIMAQKDFAFHDTYVASLSLPLSPILGASTSIYVKNSTEPDSSYVLLATADSNGIITGAAGYDTLGSEINTNSGTGTLIVNSGLSNAYNTYSLRVIYRPNVSDFVLGKRYYIFAYENAFITTSYPTS